MKGALVTGSAKRLGAEICRHLAKCGYSVALHYNSAHNEVVELSTELSQTYPTQLFPVLQYDLTNWKQSHTIYDQIPANFPPINLLINNASVFSASSISNLSDKELDANFSLHLFTPLKLIQSFAKNFKEGVIINMIDSAVNKIEFDYAAYLLSKKSLMDLTQIAALEYSPSIRVNGINPGPLLPSESGGTDKFKLVVSNSPLQEKVAISSILQTIDFIMLNEHMTGQIINVDSGIHLT